MSASDLERFESFALSFAGVSIVDQWESRVAKVGGKVFALIRLTPPDPHAIVFKCREDSFVVLTGMEGIRQAPYFAKRQWVCVSADAELTLAEREAYLRRSYQLVAAGLTRKIRLELGVPFE
jgi:predicted DNA-binding protein (MmcQ/YjbR family)